jgi:hypothetical protein
VNSKVDSSGERTPVALRCKTKKIASRHTLAINAD